MLVGLEVSRRSSWHGHEGPGRLTKEDEVLRVIDPCKASLPVILHRP
jgi:hypothetical protein